MEKDIKEPILMLCECSSCEHQIIIREIEEDFYFTIHLSNLTFWKRLKYLFGYKCRYGAFEEFIVNKSDFFNKIVQ